MTVDELGSYGLARMDDAEIDGFLQSQSTGVLGLPGEEVPYLLPMSFGYDGASLYVTFVLGTESRKGALTGEGTRARFLVYRADTAFNWESVLLTGRIGPVPEGERDAVLESTTVAWRPDLFERAEAVERADLYRFRIEDRSGIKHTGLPPAFEREAPESE